MPRRRRRSGPERAERASVQRDVDLSKLESLIAREGAGQIAYVSLAGTVNMAGGQPVSLGCVHALRAFCDRHGIRLFLDATRMVENAFFS